MLGLSFLSRPGMIMPSSNDLRGLMPVLEKEKKIKQPNKQTPEGVCGCASREHEKLQGQACGLARRK